MTEAPVAETIEAAVERAKHQARRAGVKEEHLDAVAAVMVALDACHGSRGGGELAVDHDNALHFEETLAEWATEYNLESHVDRFVAIAGYLLDKQEQRSLDTEIVVSMYKEARWKQPQNPADVFSKAAARLFFTGNSNIEGRSSLKQWALTRTGYQHLSSLRREH